MRTAQVIAKPKRGSISPHSAVVQLNLGTKEVSGLDSLLSTQGGAIVCTKNRHGHDQWYLCQSVEAAASVLQRYYDGELSFIRWYARRA